MLDTDENYEVGYGYEISQVSEGLQVGHKLELKLEWG